MKPEEFKVGECYEDTTFEGMTVIFKIIGIEEKEHYGVIYNSVHARSILPSKLKLDCYFETVSDFAKRVKKLPKIKRLLLV